MATNKKEFFKYKWLRGRYAPTRTPLSCFWSLPKKHIPRAVDRNRLRRWGRENLKKLRSSGWRFESRSFRFPLEDGISAKAGISEKLQNSSRIDMKVTGHLTLTFLPENRGFYRDLRRKEFDHVFFKLLEKFPEMGG